MEVQKLNRDMEEVRVSSGNMVIFLGIEGGFTWGLPLVYHEN